MLFIDDVRDAPVPACAAAPAFSALIRRGTCFCCCAHGRRPWPPAWRRSVDGPLTLVADTLINKFFGMIAGSMNWSSLYSRVGSQCLASGVALATSIMFLRWSGPCRSPESCHLKYLWPVISVIMAAVHDPWVNAFRRRIIAAC